MQLVDCVNIKTSSLHRQCHQVIDEKISDRIVISDNESESRDYSAWRSSDSLITLIYWESLNSSSLLNVRSYIYLREELRVHENDQNVFSTIDQSHASNDCDCTSILTIYSTSTWHKSNQEKIRVIQYNHTLSFHHAHFSFITHFSAQWMTIIEQENTVSALQLWASWMQRNVFHLWIKNWIETSLYKISSMKSRTKMMCHNQTAQTLLSRIYLSIMRWIEAINLLLII